MWGAEQSAGSVAWHPGPSPASPERGADGSGLELDAVWLKSSVWRANRASPDTPPCRTPPKKEKL